MRRKSLLLVMLLAGGALADPGLDAVRTLGRLNGEALACKQMALVDRIRTHIIYEAPKTREIGEAFEAATSERFLAMGARESVCPDSRVLAERIESARQALHKAFGVAEVRKP